MGDLQSSTGALPTPRTPLLAVGVDDAAYALGVSRRHIYTLIDSGELRSFMSRGRRLIRLSEIERYMDAREN